MLSLFKQIIISIILVSFLTLVFFGLTIMMHGPDAHWQNNCPFSALGASLCPRDIFAVTFHHISAYYAFLNVPIYLHSDVIALIVALLFIAYIVFILFTGPPLLKYSIRIDYYDPSRVTLYKRKLTRWLSLFENSPSPY